MFDMNEIGVVSFLDFISMKDSDRQKNRAAYDPARRNAEKAAQWNALLKAWLEILQKFLTVLCDCLRLTFIMLSEYNDQKHQESEQSYNNTFPFVRHLIVQGDVMCSLRDEHPQVMPVKAHHFCGFSVNTSLPAGGIRDCHTQYLRFVQSKLAIQFVSSDPYVLQCVFAQSLNVFQKSINGNTIDGQAVICIYPPLRKCVQMAAYGGRFCGAERPLLLFR